jgi:hypothetical protein
MGDIQAVDVLHNEHQVETPSNSSNNSAQDDLEKHASHGAGYDMSGIPVADGEYVVTAKTWAVVIVRDLFICSYTRRRDNLGSY